MRRVLLSTSLAAAGIVALLSAWFTYWKNQVRNYKNSGYAPPPTSLFREFFFYGICRVIIFVTVGPLKVVHGKLERGVSGKWLFFRHKNKFPDPGGPLVIMGPHQFPVDFALLRAGTGSRHVHMLGTADHLKGLVGLLAALVGVISIGFKSKEEKDAAEQACVKALRSEHNRIPKQLGTLMLSAGLIGLYLSLHFGHQWLAGVIGLLTLVVAIMPASEPALGIFPEGTLYPDNPDLKELMRPGGFRIARAVEECGKRAHLVLVGIVYHREPSREDWSHKIFGKTRSLFQGKRNPKFTPEYRAGVNLDSLPAEERDMLESRREELMQAYRASRLTLYGATVLVSDPFPVSELPEDPILAMQEIRERIAVLCSRG